MEDILQQMMFGSQPLYSRISNFVSHIDNFGYYANDQEHRFAAQNANPRLPQEPLVPVQEKYGQSMYHFMITDGINDIQNKSLLEISSGTGKGAAYIAQQFNPFKYVGMDLNQIRVQSSQQYWGHLDNLEFTVGDAMHIPFPNNSFNIVLNVESSFHYESFEQFISEVFRVLEPGGTFLWTAPLLHRDDTATVKNHQFTRAGFKILKKQYITQNVLAARDRVAKEASTTELNIYCKDLYYIFSGTCSPAESLWQFTALPGSIWYNLMSSGQAPYLRFVAVKPVKKSGTILRSSP